MAGGNFGDQEVDRDLALRRQQGPEPAEARAQQRDVRRNEAVEKVARVVAAHLHYAPVGKKRCFHAKFSCYVIGSSWGNAGGGYHIRT